MICKDALLICGIVALIGVSLLYLHVNQDKTQTDVLHIVIIGLVQRLIGTLLQVIMDRVQKVSYQLKAAIYKKEFVDMLAKERRARIMS